MPFLLYQGNSGSFRGRRRPWNGVVELYYRSILAAGASPVSFRSVSSLLTFVLHVLRLEGHQGRLLTMVITKPLIDKRLPQLTSTPDQCF